MTDSFSGDPNAHKVLPGPGAPARLTFVERQPVEEQDVTPGLIEMARAVASIAATRILVLIAALGAVAIFLWAAWDPLPWRTATAATYAVLVQWPLVYLYLRKG